MGCRFDGHHGGDPQRSFQLLFPRVIKIQREEVLLAVAEANITAAAAADSGEQQLKTALGIPSVVPVEAAAHQA